MNKETHHKDWNKNFSVFLQLQFTAIHKFIDVFDDFENPIKILSKITDDFDIIAIENLPITCQVIGSLLNKVRLFIKNLLILIKFDFLVT